MRLVYLCYVHWLFSWRYHALEWAVAVAAWTETWVVSVLSGHLSVQYKDPIESDSGIEFAFLVYL
jgi:hypothetical protein